MAFCYPPFSSSSSEESLGIHAGTKDRSIVHPSCIHSSEYSLSTSVAYHLVHTSPKQGQTRRIQPCTGEQSLDKKQDVTSLTRARAGFSSSLSCNQSHNIKHLALNLTGFLSTEFLLLKKSLMKASPSSLSSFTTRACSLHYIEDST